MENTQYNKVRVIWEDTIDNQTKVNAKKITDYFKTKYNASTVNISKQNTTVRNKSEVDVTDMDIDVSHMVISDDFQLRLINQYLDNNEIDIDRNLIYRLNSKINGLIEGYKESTIRNRNIRPLDIKFDNFLSYGSGNVIDFTKYNGLTTIKGYPENYSGKTTLAVDLLLFLFFGKTTKTDVLHEIFNKFVSDDILTVRGRVAIDDKIYVIKRSITRKKKRDGSFNAEGRLELYLEDEKGNLIQENKETAVVTDSYIQELVGTYNDFLITILTTGDNLDDLIRTKPTERGKLFTRYVGLEIFDKKFDVAKADYKAWYSGTKLSQHSKANLKIDNENSLTQVTELKEQVDNLQEEYDNDQKTILIYEEKLGKLYSKKRPVDNDTYSFNKDFAVSEIERLELRKDQYVNDISKAKEVVDNSKPDIDFNDYDYKSAQSDVRTLVNKVASIKSEIQSFKRDIENINNSDLCPHCGKHINHLNVEEKVSIINDKIVDKNKELVNFENELAKSEEYISGQDELKKAWDTYNMNNLAYSRKVLELQELQNKIDRYKNDLDKFLRQQSDIEHNKEIDIELNKLNYDLKQVKDNSVLKYKSIANISNQITNLQDQISKNEKLIIDISKEEKIDKVYKVYLDIFGKNGISKMVLATMIPVMNQHLENLTYDSSSEFKLEVRLNDKEELDFWMIDNLTGIERPLKSGSGYEKTISSLALRCVLAKICSLPKLSIIVFDEITGKVAKSNMQNIESFFQKIKDYFDNIFIISHDETVQDWGENIIMVEKENNISKILN